MKFQRKKVAVALGSVLGAGMTVGLLTVPGLAAAQQITREYTTGSHTITGETSLPVQILTRDDIAKTGVTTAMDLMNYVAANSSFGAINAAGGVGATTFGVQTASLRGLGGGFTLVLVNGQRMPNFSGEVAGTGGGVDLNAIPFAAIERVEILKDGASAIYGSDAVAGVINFILRQDYRGADVSVYYNTPTRSGGGYSWNAQATAGWGDLAKDRYNVFISGSYNEQQELFAKDRDFAKTGIINTPTSSDYVNVTSGNANPGNISTSATGATWNPSAPGCSPLTNTVTNPTNPNNCRYDFVHDTELIPQTKIGSLFGSGRFQINNDWQAYLTASASETKTNVLVQSVPISDQFPTLAVDPISATYDGSITILPTSPFYPTAGAIANGVAGQPLNVRYRCLECGKRALTDTNDQYQIVAGVKGTWKTWDIEGNFVYGESKNKEVLTGGYPELAKILPLVNSGTVNLFGPNTPAVQAELQATNFNGQTFDGKSTSTGLNVTGTSEIWKAPAGPVSLAIGGDWYHQTFEQTPSSVLATGDISGYGGNFLDINQSRDNYAVFAELNIPIVKNFEGNVAVRYDHYSDFGSTTNPKFSLRWNPMPSLLLRASYGTGFLAPTLLQLFNPNTISVTTAVDDPLRCPTTQSSTDCGTQFQTQLGGNPHLLPQLSEQMGAGFVLEPTFLPGFTFGMDLFKINVSQNIVSGLDPNFILQHLDQYGFLVTRGPVQPQFPTLPGPITQIAQENINIGNIHIVGTDVHLAYNFPKSDWGRWKFNIDGTYYMKYAFENPDGTYLGTVGNPGNSPSSSGTSGVIPRWKHYATLSWNSGPWGATLGNTYVNSYTDVNTDNNGNLRTVGALSLWDIQGVYTGFKNWTLTLGAKNMFDTNPAFTNTPNNNFQQGYDVNNYDARARLVYGSIAWTWR